jgi:hypothetical protein
MPITPLERPGVKVTQNFRTSTASFARPLMPACPVGPCIQVVEAVQDDGSLNPDALISVPARFVAPWVTTPFTYANIGGNDLVLRVSGGAAQTITFSGTGARTAAQIVDDIVSAAIAGLTARVEISGTQRRVVIETTQGGDLASLQVEAATTAGVLTSLGLLAGEMNRGASGYSNFTALDIQTPDYPDPRNNISELSIDYDSIRVFITDGAGNIREVLRTETFLQGATSAVTAPTDGDGDNLTPYLQFAGADFSAGPSTATTTGTTDLTTLTYATDVIGRTLVMSIDGEQEQSLTFGGGVTSAALLVAAVNNLWGAGVAALSGGDELELSSLDTNGGVESSIRINKTLSDATLLTNLGLTGVGDPFETVDVITGDPFDPKVGDEVWVDGVRRGTVVEVVASPTNRLRMDTENLLTFTGATWYIISKGLDNNASSATEPSSDLIVNEATGTIRIKQELYRETNGAAPAAGPLNVYVAYDALRLDVSPVGTGFNLLRYGSTTDLQDDLGPLDPQNPLGLAMYFAMLNAPAFEITGVGIDETSASAPEGTQDAYVRAFEFLESKDVYAIVPLTHDLTVAQVGQAHVNAMSDPEIGQERILIFTPQRPDRLSDTVVASGTRANVAGVPTDIVSTGVPNLQALLAAAGVPGPAFVESDNVFLQFEDDSNNYPVQSVSGGFITVNNGVLTENDDGFYLDGGGSAVFSEVIIDRPWSLKIRGAAVANLTEEATAYGEIAQGFSDRRVIATAPDTVTVTIDGLDQNVPGYYLAAGLAGRFSSKLPQTPLTEATLTGFRKVIGSQDRYGEQQLKIMSGGGLWIFYQNSDSDPARVRHQLSTDMSSVERRETSITTALDAFAKITRTTFRNYIGQFNITTNLIDQLTVAADGLRRFVLGQGLFEDLSWGAFTQPDEEPDALIVEALVTPLYPCNKIRVAIVV